ncbi:prenyltransferase [Perkinsela sp. CCAP 1560/4]|nr:prenyltransferase [Perkinsela sp. CCAP 1560/4]|eukprot:KNH03772.1 prenyltransferase [Perkinsela sp. CCAP 1560/4]
MHLIRFHNPTGTMLLLLPCYMGMLAGWSRLLRTSAAFDGNFSVLHMCDPTLPMIFLLGAFTMRSAGCIINDLWDRRIDAQVERTKHRPLASGAMQVQTAYKILFGHLSLGLGVLLCLHPTCFPISLCAIPLVVLYPLAKRCTSCPQLILGLCFNWGVFVGNAAVLGTVDWITCLAIYAGCVSWTILYDTVYAFQDIRDDRRIGVKSFAVHLDGKKNWLVRFIWLTKLLFITGGASANQSLVYYLTIGGSARYLIRGFRQIDADQPQSCAAFFRRNAYFGWLCVLAWFIGNICLYCFTPIQDEDEVDTEDGDQISAKAWKRWVDGHDKHLASHIDRWEPVHFQENCQNLMALLRQASLSFTSS